MNCRFYEIVVGDEVCDVGTGLAVGRMSQPEAVIFE
jgi:hypothetical protein